MNFRKTIEETIEDMVKAAVKEGYPNGSTLTFAIQEIQPVVQQQYDAYECCLAETARIVSLSGKTMKTDEVRKAFSNYSLWTVLLEKGIPSFDKAEMSIGCAGEKFNLTKVNPKHIKTLSRLIDKWVASVVDFDYVFDKFLKKISEQFERPSDALGKVLIQKILSFTLDSGKS